MKTSKFLVGVVLILIFFYSCDSNQRDVQELIDPWLRERTPIAFKVEGQVGEAVIVNNWRKDEDGSINVTLISSAINDLRNVQVLSLELQYNATSSLGVGGFKRWF